MLPKQCNVIFLQCYNRHRSVQIGVHTHNVAPLSSKTGYKKHTLEWVLCKYRPITCKMGPTTAAYQPQQSSTALSCSIAINTLKPAFPRQHTFNLFMLSSLTQQLREALSQKSNILPVAMNESSTHFQDINHLPLPFSTCHHGTNG